MRALVGALRVGLLHHLRFRGEVLLQLLGVLMVALLNSSIWTVAARSAPLIGGQPGEHWRTQVLVAWAGFALMSGRVHEELGQRGRDGLIAMDLLRPRSVQALYWARDAGRAVAALCFSTLPLLLICAALVPMRWPSAPSTWALWLLSLGLGQLVSFGISFLFALLALELHQLIGLSYLRATLMSVFSGALLPIPLLPEPLHGLARVLPFQALAASPAGVFLEQGPAWHWLLPQAAWALGLALLGALGWARLDRRLTVLGG